MTQASIRPGQLYAWAGGSLLVSDAAGRCDDAFPLSGYYFHETRFLSRCVFTIDEEAPWLCESTAADTDELNFTFTYPEITAYGGGGTGQSGDEAPRNAAGLPQRALEIHLTYELSHDRLLARATVVNRAREAVCCRIAWCFDADFADMPEALGDHREQIAEVAACRNLEEVRFEYRHPQLAYATSVRFTPDVTWDERTRSAIVPIALDPGAQMCLEADIAPQGVDGRVAPAARRRHLERWRESFTRIAAPGNRMFESVVSANVRDFASFPLLDGPRDEWLALQAGTPLYPAFFGRDALTAGWQAAIVDRGQAAEAALTRLGRLQADRVDDWRDAQPGRIPQQVRRGPLAVLGLNPFSAYYADYASPLMFVISLANLFAWTGDVGQLARHWDAARRILDWAREYGDADRDGYLEYQTRSPHGPKHQGWKDSGDAVVYEDGSPVPTPVATCELQGYWYAAQQLMALLCAVRGDWREARANFSAASDLKKRFNRDWWSEREQFVAFAMDPDKRVIDAPTSNVGHCLASGIIARAHLEATVSRLFEPDLFSGWGVRTLTSSHPFYDPLSYHRGSVWAVEQATILFGLRRFGFEGRAHQLAEALFDLARLYPQYRIPECVGGHARRDRVSPGVYPQANAPQLWNAGSFPLVVQSLLGIIPWARHHLLFVDPALPPWLPEVRLDDLRVGDAAVTLRFQRRPDGSSDFDVLHRRGTLHVIRQPPPESVSAGPIDRLASLRESMFR